MRHSPRELNYLSYTQTDMDIMTYDDNHNYDDDDGDDYHYSLS